MVDGQTTKQNQRNEAKALNEQAVQLYNAGKYAEVEPLYKSALEIQEQKLGKDDPLVALSLNNMAYFYKTTGRYARLNTCCQDA